MTSNAIPNGLPDPFNVAFAPPSFGSGKSFRLGVSNVVPINGAVTVNQLTSPILVTGATTAVSLPTAVQLYQVVAQQTSVGETLVIPVYNTSSASVTFTPGTGITGTKVFTTGTNGFLFIRTTQLPTSSLPPTFQLL